MIINKLEPQGYCGGVIRALEMAKEISKTKNNTVYMLGKIIHNQHVINELEKLGIKTIEDKSKSRLELLDSIPAGTVIFSAHGVSPKVYQKALSKNLNIVDATCPYVLVVQKNIKNYFTYCYTINYSRFYYFYWWCIYSIIN